MNRPGLVKSSNYAWCVMILLTLMQFVYAGLTLSTVTLYMNPILSAHPELSRTAYSLTITLNGGANAIISVFYGKFVEKVGMKTMVSVCSLMMIAGDISDTRYMTEGVFEKATGTDDKELFLIEGAQHIETYWQEDYVSQELNKLVEFFGDKLA